MGHSNRTLGTRDPDTSTPLCMCGVRLLKGRASVRCDDIIYKKSAVAYQSKLCHLPIPARQAANDRLGDGPKRDRIGPDRRIRATAAPEAPLRRVLHEFENEAHLRIRKIRFGVWCVRRGW
ncbi:serine/threonine-protein kinase Nek9 [Anopheles sinensis]|uniref:Serine/threonine-protein kinase Nek9 n=1 Tax=Anopheles sinensis TaxID=74873 RepID=A0A084VVT6_ANOSI|nr:serine/threonine-protein kinase Nek9 [Anopheles sinensis]